jgi:hypothetical protein
VVVVVVGGVNGIASMACLRPAIDVSCAVIFALYLLVTFAWIYVASAFTNSLVRLAACERVGCRTAI